MQINVHFRERFAFVIFMCLLKRERARGREGAREWHRNAFSPRVKPNTVSKSFEGSAEQRIRVAENLTKISFFVLFLPLAFSSTFPSPLAEQMYI